MGYGRTMEDWDATPGARPGPAQPRGDVRHSGVGRTQQLLPPFTIVAMADRTSAIIDTSASA